MTAAGARALDNKTVELLLLGDVEVAVDGQAAGLAGTVPKAVLAVLGLNGRAISTAAVVDQVWDGNPPKSARAALRNTVARLRKQFGPNIIDSHDGTYKLGPAVGVDALKLASAVDARSGVSGPQDIADALSAVRGEPFGDLDLASLSEHREKLRVLIGRAHRVLAQAWLDGGQPERAEGAARAALVGDPYDEALAGVLMKALYRQGQAQQALTVFGQMRRRLGEDLGLEPSPALRQIETAVLLHDDVTLAPSPRLGSGVPASLKVYLTPWFAGRGAELGELRSAVEGLSSARPGMVAVVSGHAGMGKTRLLAEFADWCCDNGVSVLHGWAEPDLEETMPALAPVLSALNVTAAPHAETSVQATEVAKALAQQAADAPLVVAIDDVHAADSATLRLLIALAKHRVPNVALVLAARPTGDAPGRWGRVRDELVSRNNATLLDLTALAEHDASHFVHAFCEEQQSPISGDDRDAIVAAAGGSPFLLRSLAEASLFAQVRPSDAASALQRTLRSVDNDAVDLLAQAATLGTEFDVETLARTVDQDLEQVLNKLRRPLQLSILVSGESNATMRFSHDLWRVAAYEGGTSDQRRERHRRAAEALSAWKHPPLAQVAHHLRAAVPLVPRELASVASEDAGVALSAAQAFDEAVGAFEAAVSLGRGLRDDAAECDLLLKLADALERADRHSDAIRVLAEVTELARRNGLWAKLAEAALTAASHGQVFGGETETLDWLRQALAVPQAPELRVELLTQLATRNPGATNSAPLLALVDEAEEVAVELGNPDLDRMIVQARLDLLASEPLTPTYAQWIERLHALSQHDPALRVNAATRRATLHLTLGQIDLAEADIAELGAAMSMVPKARPRWWHGILRSEVAQLRGDFEQGLAISAATRVEARRAGIAEANASASIHRWVTAMLRGTLADELSTITPLFESYPTMVLFAGAHASALAAAGQTDAARQCCVETTQLLARKERELMWPFGLAWTAEAALAVGVDEQTAQTLATLCAPYAGLWPQLGAGGSTLGPMDRIRAGLAASLGDAAEARRLYIVAEDQCESAGAKPWLVWTLADRAMLGPSVESSEMERIDTLRQLVSMALPQRHSL